MGLKGLITSSCMNSWYGVKTFVITGVLISHSEKKLVLSVPLYINDFSQLEGRRDNLLHSCRMTFWFLSEGIVSHFFGNQL